MKFKVKALSYLFGRLVPEGEIYDYPDDKLPRNEDGSIRFEKLSQLEPVKSVKATAPKAEAPKESEADEDEGGEDETTELTDEQKAQAVKDAVDALDKGVDADWTKGGLPSVETVKEIVGFDVTRKDIEAVAPGVTRPAE
jgi:hypothetical protein